MVALVQLESLQDTQFTIIDLELLVQITRNRVNDTQ